MLLLTQVETRFFRYQYMLIYMVSFPQLFRNQKWKHNNPITSENWQYTHQKHYQLCTSLTYGPISFSFIKVHFSYSLHFTIAFYQTHLHLPVI